MTKIYVYFVHRKTFNPLSILIRFLQKDKSSHVAIAINTNWERTLIYHASAIGVNFENHDYFMRKYEIDKSFMVEIESIGEIFRYCIDNLNSSYSLRSLFFHLFSFFGITISALLPSKGFICSSLVGHVLRSQGIKLDDDPKRWDIIKAKQFMGKYYASNS